MFSDCIKMTFDNQNDTLGFGDTHSEHGLIGISYILFIFI